MHKIIANFILLFSFLGGPLFAFNTHQNKFVQFLEPNLYFKVYFEEALTLQDPKQKTQRLWKLLTHPQFEGGFLYDESGENPIPFETAIENALPQNSDMWPYTIYSTYIEDTSFLNQPHLYTEDALWRENQTTSLERLLKIQKRLLFYKYFEGYEVAVQKLFKLFTSTVFRPELALNLWLTYGTVLENEAPTALTQAVMAGWWQIFQDILNAKPQDFWNQHMDPRIVARLFQILNDANETEFQSISKNYQATYGFLDSYDETRFQKDEDTRLLYLSQFHAPIQTASFSILPLLTESTVFLYAFDKKTGVRIWKQNLLNTSNMLDVPILVTQTENTLNIKTQTSFDNTTIDIDLTRGKILNFLQTFNLQKKEILTTQKTNDPSQVQEDQALIHYYLNLFTAQAILQYEDRTIEANHLIMLLFEKIKKIAPITSSQNISFLRNLYFNPPHPKMQGSLIGFIRRVQGMEGFELLRDVYLAESQKENGSLEVLRVLLEDIFTMAKTQDETFQEKMALFLLEKISRKKPSLISRYLAILQYKPSIPVLQEILNSPETDTREKIYVQMDLAYLGDQTIFEKIVQEILQGNYNVIIAERIANAELIDLMDPILGRIFTEFSKNGCTPKFTNGLAALEIIMKKSHTYDMVGKILNFYTKIFRHCFNCETEQWIMLRSMVLMQIDDYEKEVADFMWNLLSTDRFSRISIRLKLIPFLLIQKKVWGLRMVILLLAHADPKIQKEAERALKQRKAEEVLPHLQELVKNTQDPILAFKAAQLVTYFTGKKSPMKLRK